MKEGGGRRMGWTGEWEGGRGIGGGRGQGNRRGGRGMEVAGEERTGQSGIPNSQGGRIQKKLRKNLQHCLIFCERNRTKRQDLLQKGVEMGSKRYRRQEV